MFRQYLAEHGFNVPNARSYTSYEDAEKNIDSFKFPVMVKPVDSSGSKGINKLVDKEQLKVFFEDALTYSREKIVIIEEFIEKQGPQISGDAFSVDGELVFHCLGNEFYSTKVDKDFAPLGECWPTIMPQSVIDQLTQDLQRLISSLGMKSTAYNVEAIYGKDGKVYILELGARSGGSLIPQITALATGVDMVPYVIKAAMGEDCSELKMAPVKGFWSNYMVHSHSTGRFLSIDFDDYFKKHLVDWVTDIKKGDLIHKFRDAQDCIGELILRYENKTEMFEIIQNVDKHIHINIQSI